MLLRLAYRSAFRCAIKQQSFLRRRYMMTTRGCSGCKFFSSGAGGVCEAQPPTVESGAPNFDERFVNPLECHGKHDEFVFERQDDLSELLNVVDTGIRSLKDGSPVKMLVVPQDVIERLTERAFIETMHFLRRHHLQQLRNILDDPDASGNDRFVAMQLLKNACIASGGYV